jgi:hypothetical protein
MLLLSRNFQILFFLVIGAHNTTTTTTTTTNNNNNNNNNSKDQIIFNLNVSCRVESAHMSFGMSSIGAEMDVICAAVIAFLPWWWWSVKPCCMIQYYYSYSLYDWYDSVFCIQFDPCLAPSF